MLQPPPIVKLNPPTPGTGITGPLYPGGGPTGQCIALLPLFCVNPGGGGGGQSNSKTGSGINKPKPSRSGGNSGTAPGGGSHEHLIELVDYLPQMSVVSLLPDTTVPVATGNAVDLFTPTFILFLVGVFGLIAVLGLVLINISFRTKRKRKSKR